MKKEEFREIVENCRELIKSGEHAKCTCPKVKCEWHGKGELKVSGTFFANPRNQRLAIPGRLVQVGNGRLGFSSQTCRRLRRIGE
jgi:hypothetical protein